MLTFASWSMLGEVSYYNQKWVLSACRLKVGEEARLVERKVCFILDAGTWGGGRMDLLTIIGQNFYRQRKGATCRNSTVSSDSHLEIGHRWSDQRHLDGLSTLQFQGLFVSISLSPILRIVAVYVMAQRRQWHPTLVLLPGKSHGRRRLVGCSPWGR